MDTTIICVLVARNTNNRGVPLYAHLYSGNLECPYSEGLFCTSNKCELAAHEKKDDPSAMMRY